VVLSIITGLEHTRDSGDGISSGGESSVRDGGPIDLDYDGGDGDDIQTSATKSEKKRKQCRAAAKVAVFTL
jgi:hypothetical protein